MSEDAGKLVPIYDGKYHTLVSLNDLPKIASHTLAMNPGGYAFISQQGANIMLSHFLFKKPEDGNVIDHINSNRLDNRQSNLREVTYSQNSQNRKKQQDTYTSNYSGVFWDKKWQKWIASCTKDGKYHRKSFIDEEDAAKFYDQVAICCFGIGAKTNNKLTKEEIEKALITPPPEPQLVRKRKHPELMKGVSYNEETKKYSVSVYHAGKQHWGGNHETEELANERVETLLTSLQMDDVKVEEIIPRNDEGFVYILAASKKLGPTRALVDESYFHEINNHAWYITDSGYVAARIEDKMWRLHRWIWTKEKGDIPTDKVIDHVNHVRTDCRMENLRLLTHSENAHNRIQKKGTSSKYPGVVWDNYTQNWRASVTYHGVRKCFGRHETEEKAFQAYCENVALYYPNVYSTSAQNPLNSKSTNSVINTTSGS